MPSCLPSPRCGSRRASSCFSRNSISSAIAWVCRGGVPAADQEVVGVPDHRSMSRMTMSRASLSSAIRAMRSTSCELSLGASGGVSCRDLRRLTDRRFFQGSTRFAGRGRPRGTGPRPRSAPARPRVRGSGSGARLDALADVARTRPECAACRSTPPRPARRRRAGCPAAGRRRAGRAAGAASPRATCRARRAGPRRSGGRGSSPGIAVRQLAQRVDHVRRPVAVDLEPGDVSPGCRAPPPGSGAGAARRTRRRRAVRRAPVGTSTTR